MAKVKDGRTLATVAERDRRIVNRFVTNYLT
jgi:hypothetical protein